MRKSAKDQADALDAVKSERTSYASKPGYRSPYKPDREPEGLFDRPPGTVATRINRAAKKKLTPKPAKVRGYSRISDEL